MVSDDTKPVSTIETNEFRLLTKLYARASRKCIKTFLDKSKRNVDEVFKVGSSTPHPFSWTGLLCSCRNLNLGAVEELLERGANPNLAVNDGLSPLMAVSVAASEKNTLECIACARLLLEAGASIQKAEMFKGFTLLTRALKNNAEDYVKFLVTRGADPNVKDGHGETPLSMAITHQQMGLVKFLMDHGAKPLLISNASTRAVSEATMEATSYPSVRAAGDDLIKINKKYLWFLAGSVFASIFVLCYAKRFKI